MPPWSLCFRSSTLVYGITEINSSREKLAYGKPLKIGALICFTASTVYVVIGLSYYYLFAPDFIDVYAEYLIRNAAAEDVEAVKTQMANFKEMYSKPMVATLITYMEVLPLGLVVAFISAFIVKKI